jgi:hypothetical protein
MGVQPMKYYGKVVNGTVVLPPDVQLPEGATVSVQPLETLADHLKDFIGIVDDMPADWAEQHDHYIHGTPKK